jgi:DNA-directed RNA polymerase specialized sigma24 family protein
VIRRQQVNEILVGITDTRTRKAAQMVMLGYEYADAGAAAGLSADAVEGRLYRLRRRPR